MDLTFPRKSSNMMCFSLLACYQADDFEFVWGLCVPKFFSSTGSALVTGAVVVALSLSVTSPVHYCISEK
jgi:hypothetical protein